MWIGFCVLGSGQAAELEAVDKLKVRQGIEFSVSPAASPLIFASSTTNPGNVGIGTTTPAFKLEVAGTVNATQITCPGCTGMQVRIAGSCAPGESIRTVNQNGTVVCEVVTPPSVIVLSTSTCPSGFAELTSFAGRFIKGVPLGGTVGSVAIVGTPLGELALIPSHSHSFTPAGTVSSSFSGTAGLLTTFTDASHTHTANAIGAVGLGGPSATSCRGNWTACTTTSNDGHGHTTTSIGAVGTSGPSPSLNHQHSLSPPPAGTVSSSFAGSAGTTAATDHTPPYIQVRLCMKI